MKIERHSPSSLNLFAASPSMYVLERVLGHRQPVGAPAHRGTAVEAGVAHGLADLERSWVECTRIALEKYDTITALSGDPRRESYRDDIGGMVKSALEELSPYGHPTSTQGFVEWRPEGLLYPIVGYYDFRWDDHGIILDLKTSSKLVSEIKPAHARQVALYASASDNIDARLTYVTPKKRATYRLENAREHLRALHKIALVVERFLALSDDPEFFVSITAPDIESYYWTPPRARQKAYELWQI
jgi:hypothetical protein